MPYSRIYLSKLPMGYVEKVWAQNIFIDFSRNWMMLRKLLFLTSFFWGSWFSFDLLKSPASPESLLFVQSKIAKLSAVSFLVSWDFLVCHWPADRQEGDSDLLIRRGKYMKIHTRLTRTAYIQLGYQRNSILSAQPEPYLTYKRQQRAAAASQNTKWHLSHCLRPSTSGSWHIWTKGCDIWNQEIWIKSRFGPMQCLVQTSMIQASYWSQCPLGKMAFVHCPTYDLQRLLPFTVYKTGCRKEKDTK